MEDNIISNHGIILNRNEKDKKKKKEYMSDAEMALVTSYSASDISEMSTKEKQEIKSNFTPIYGVAMDSKEINGRHYRFSEKALKNSVKYFNETVGKIPYLHNLYVDHERFNIENLIGASVERSYDEKTKQLMFKAYINNGSKVGGIIDSIKNVSTTVDTEGDYACSICAPTEECIGDYYGECEQGGLLEFNTVKEIELSVVTFPAIKSAAFSIGNKAEKKDDDVKLEIQSLQEEIKNLKLKNSLLEIKNNLEAICK